MIQTNNSPFNVKISI